jgi:hypothetical protein
MKKIKLYSRISDRGGAKHDFMTGLVLNKDWNDWRLQDGTPVYPMMIMLMAARNDRDFFIKLGKALYEKRHSKNALVHNFILAHWDELKGLTAEKACELLSNQFSDRSVFTADNYRKILKRLPLKPDK